MKEITKKGVMLSQMLQHVAKVHQGQFDRGGSPYILHVLKVLDYIDIDDEELQCIALGHDTIEDTNTTSQDLKNIGMTERIVSGIVALTKIDGQTPDEYKSVVFSNRDAMLVKLCDLRHNSDLNRLKNVTEKDIERARKYQKFSIEIVEKLVDTTAV